MDLFQQQYIRGMAKMNNLEKLILKKLGEKEMKATELLSINGYTESEVAQAILSLECDGKVECIGFDAIIGKHDESISIPIYKKR